MRLGLARAASVRALQRSPVFSRCRRGCYTDGVKRFGRRVSRGGDTTRFPAREDQHKRGRAFSAEEGDLSANSWSTAYFGSPGNFVGGATAMVCGLVLSKD